LFSAKPNEIAKAAENFIEEGKAKDQKTAQRTDRYLQFVAAGLKPENGVITVFEEDLTPFELKRFAGMLKEKFPNDAVGVFSSIDGGFNYVIASSDPELPKISKSLNGQLNGRGGGRDGMVQGTYRADKSAVEEAFRETFSK
jgi:alanyl-tRNA synthetase